MVAAPKERSPDNARFHPFRKSHAVWLLDRTSCGLSEQPSGCRACMLTPMSCHRWRVATSWPERAKAIALFRDHRCSAMRHHRYRKRMLCQCIWPEDGWRNLQEKLDCTLKARARGFLVNSRYSSQEVRKRWMAVQEAFESYPCKTQEIRSDAGSQ